MFRASADKIRSVRMYVISSLSEATSLRAGLRRAGQYDDFSSKEDLAVAADN